MTAPWPTLAACNDYPTDLWFPAQGNTGVDAKRVCVTCPVRLPCLAARLERGEDGGIWGGHGEAVGRYLRRLYRAQTPGGWPAMWAFLRFVAAVTVEGERLVVEARTGRAPEGGPDRSGPGARHGTIARYKKGCAGVNGCDACYVAMVMRTAEYAYREDTAA